MCLVEHYSRISLCTKWHPEKSFTTAGSGHIKQHSWCSALLQYPLWDSFVMHHFAALMVEKVPNLQPVSSKSVRALLLRAGLSTVLAAKAVSLWHRDLCRAVTGTSCHQLWLPVNPHQLACLWLWSSELGVVREVAQPGRSLPLGAQGRPQPSICCYFRTEVVGEGYYCSRPNISLWNLSSLSACGFVSCKQWNSVPLPPPAQGLGLS